MATKRRKREHQALTRERIETAALTLIEEIGLTDFSMRRLAATLGCEAMSLYHHFPSKLHLLNAVLDRLLAGLTFPGPEAGWREGLRGVALAMRQLGRSYPQFAQFLIIHRLNTPTALAFLQRVIAIFEAGGFDVESAARGFRVFGYFIMGAVLDETAGYANGPGAAEPLSLEEQGRIAPSVVRLSPYFQPDQWDATFSLGLEMVLDQLEALRARRVKKR